jgi:hypothetical protein
MSRIAVSAAALLAALSGVTVWQQVQLVQLRRDLGRQSAALAQQEAARSAAITAEADRAAAQARLARAVSDLVQGCADARDAALEQGFADGTADMRRATRLATADTLRQLARLVGPVTAQRLFDLCLSAQRRPPAAVAVAAAPQPAPAPALVAVSDSRPAPPAAEAAPAPAPTVYVENVINPTVVQTVTPAAPEPAPAPAQPAMAAAYWPWGLPGSVAVTPERHERERRPVNPVAALRLFAASAGIPAGNRPYAQVGVPGPLYPASLRSVR